MSESTTKRVRTFSNPSFADHVVELRCLLVEKGDREKLSILVKAWTGCTKTFTQGDKYGRRLLYEATRMLSKPIPFLPPSGMRITDPLIYLDMNMDISPLLREPVVLKNHRYNIVSRLEEIIDTFGRDPTAIRSSQFCGMLPVAMQHRIVCTLLCLRKVGGW